MVEVKQPPSLLERFEAKLTERERSIVTYARAWSEANRAPLFLVGGSVRDLLLNRPHLDVDLALDGDTLAVATAIGHELFGEVTVFGQFGTAVVTGGDWSLDIARTRSERYAYPGALPDVEPAPIEADLIRRDFTVHAMALALSGNSSGALLDPFGGREDLTAGILRVLHEQSFRDDPTRILRLARYAARLQFAVEPRTRALARRDATFLSMVSPARITNELERTCAEPLPEFAFFELRDLHALRPIYPEFELSATLDESFGRLRGDGGPHPGLAEYLAVVVALWSRPAVQGFVDALDLRQEERAALLDVPGAGATLRTLAAEKPDPAAVVDALGRYRLAAVRGAGAATGGAVAKLVRRYLAEWRELAPLLRGGDVIALGVAAGPRVGEALRLLRAGRLRGELTTADDERACVRTWLAQQHEDGGAGAG